MRPNDSIQRDARRAQRYAGLQRQAQTTAQAEQERAQRQAAATEGKRAELRAWRLGEIRRFAERRRRQ